MCIQEFGRSGSYLDPALAMPGSRIGCAFQTQPGISDGAEQGFSASVSPWNGSEQSVSVREPVGRQYRSNGRALDSGNATAADSLAPGNVRTNYHLRCWTASLHAGLS